jgi:large subunit ribosomal protein L21
MPYLGLTGLFSRFRLAGTLDRRKKFANKAAGKRLHERRKTGPPETENGPFPAENRIEAMFAVVKTGGKQYKVAQGDVIQVEKLPGEAGAAVELGEVLALFDGGKLTAGTPTVKGASVAAEVVAQNRTGKLIVFKKKRRQNYRRKKHQRQQYTVLKITAIKA